MTRNVSLLVLLAAIALFTLAFLRVIAIFLIPLLLAAMFVVIFGPMYRWLYERLWQRAHLSSLITTLTIFLGVLVPGGFLLVGAANEGVAIISRLDTDQIDTQLSELRTRLDLKWPFSADDLYAVESTIKTLINQSESGYAGEGYKGAVARALTKARSLKRQVANLDVDETAYEELDSLIKHLEYLSTLTPADQEFLATLERAQGSYSRFKIAAAGGIFRSGLKDILDPGNERLGEWRSQALRMGRTWLINGIDDIAGTILWTIVGLVVMIIAIYFFFVDGPRMLDTVLALAPVNEAYGRHLVEDFESMSRAVVLATVLAALAQGVVAFFGFWLFGVGSVFILSVLTAFMAMIPFVGATAVWIPVALWIGFVDGDLGRGIGFALYGTFGISLIDNLIKPYVLHGQRNLHPLVAVISILGGIEALGPIGLFIGPLVVTFLHTLLVILRTEMDGTTAEADADAKARKKLQPGGAKGESAAFTEQEIPATQDQESSTEATQEDMESGGKDTPEVNVQYRPN